MELPASIHQDANEQACNLYGFSQSQPLPIGEYKWLSHTEIMQLRILDLSDDSEFGYVFVVNLWYPPQLHMKHNSYPLAVEHVTLTEEHLSAVAKNLLGGQNFPHVL